MKYVLAFLYLKVPLSKNVTLRVDYPGVLETNSPPKKVQRTEKSHYHSTVDSSDASKNLVRVVCPSDNSCLFNSVNFLTNKDSSNILHENKINSNPVGSAKMRKIIEEEVNANPMKYTEAILGMPANKYSAHITKPTTWGGGIELSMFTEHFGIEICIFDIQTGRMDRFGEDRNFKERILLLYDGLHYDPIVQKNEATKNIKKIFSTNDESVIRAAKRLSSDLQQKHSFTDLQNFTIMCKECGTPMNGQVEVAQHAKLTGHGTFIEIKK